MVLADQLVPACAGGNYLNNMAPGALWVAIALPFSPSFPGLAVSTAPNLSLSAFQGRLRGQRSRVDAQSSGTFYWEKHSKEELICQGFFKYGQEQVNPKLGFLFIFIFCILLLLFKVLRIVVHISPLFSPHLLPQPPQS